jgi:hypothetical protein
MYVFYMVKGIEISENRGKEVGRMMRLPVEGRGTSAGIFRTTSLSFDIGAIREPRRTTTCSLD